MIVPVDPFEGGEFDRFEAPPGAASSDEFGLVQPDDGLRQGVVAGVSYPAHRGFDPGLRQPLGVPHRQILPPRSE